MPTDSDWGRLYQYDTTGDAGLIMPFRSYYFRDFFPGGWTQLAVGMIYRNCGEGGDYSDVVNERQNENNAANLFHFGLSSPVNGRIDVANNPWFLGVRGVMGGLSQITTAPLQLANLQVTGVNGGAVEVSGTNQMLPIKQGVQASPFAMAGVRFTFNHDNNRVYINYKTQFSVALADDAANTTTLADFLTGIDGALTSANGAIYFSNMLKLSAFYIFWPYLHNRLILQTVGAIKLA